jgi:MFS family permease
MALPMRVRRWIILGVCALFQAYTIGLIVYCFTLWIRPFMREFGSDRAPIVGLASVAGLVMACAAPIAGWATDRFPIRWVAATGVLSFATGLLLLSQASSLWQLWVLYATLLPFGAALAGPVAAQTAVTRTFETQNGLALGICWAGTALGGLILPPLTAALIESVGWRMTHVYLGLVGLALAGPVLLVLGHVRRIAPAPTALVGADGAPPTFAAILKMARFWMILLAVVPISVVFASVQFNLGPLAGDLNFAPRTTGYALSLLSASMIAAKLSFGAMADRIDYRYLLWACIGAMVSTVIALSLETRGAYFVSVVFLGVAGGGFLPLLGVMVQNYFRGVEFGRAIGLCFFALNATYIGPWIAARMRDLTGSYILTLQIMLLLLLPASIVVSFLGRRPVVGAVRTA